MFLNNNLSPYRRPTMLQFRIPFKSYHNRCYVRQLKKYFFNVGLCWYNVLLFLFNHLLILLINQQKLEDFLLRISHIFLLF